MWRATGTPPRQRVHTVAYDSETGLELARTVSPQIIFHDIGLPLVDGYTAARELRRDPRFATTILVALTAYDSTPGRLRSLAVGFDFHIVKPIHFDDSDGFSRWSKIPAVNTDGC